VDDPDPLRQAAISRNLAQPVRLGEHGASRLSGHSRLYTIARVPEFPWVEHEHVRFRDCDAMGHVNNAVYSTYLEQARIGILGGLEPFILARVEIDFRSELRAGERVEVRSRCADLGTKSFRLAHQIWAGDRLVAEAVSVLVGYDYARNASVPITDDVKRRLTV
jgi:acyl-CoA thioester hydrolase